MLDHSSYPHILDQIVALAPPEALIRLRATSRELYHRCDAILFRHLSASSEGDIDAPHPLPRFQDDHLRHTRVLDYTGPVDFDPESEDAFSNVTVARRTLQTSSAIPAPTILNFVHFSPCHDGARQHPILYTQDGFWDWPASSKVVFCVIFGESYVPSSTYMVWMRDGHITIILSPQDNPAPLPSASLTTLESIMRMEPQTYGVLTPVLREIADHINCCTFTLVGALDIPRRVMKLPEDADVAETLVAAIATIHHEYGGETVDVGKRIQFQSLKEYREEVGEEAFMLHTVCPETIQESLEDEYEDEDNDEEDIVDENEVEDLV
jgi:hypothetical protein